MGINICCNYTVKKKLLEDFTLNVDNSNQSQYPSSEKKPNNEMNDNLKNKNEDSKLNDQNYKIISNIISTISINSIIIIFYFSLSI